MDDGDKSVFLAVNRKQGKQVQGSGHCRAVSREMLVMHGARAMEKVGGCSEETGWGQTRRGACKRV
jgi:hypothetical protein